MKIEILHPSEIPISFDELNNFILKESKILNEISSKINRGNVAEGILGCVLTAKIYLGNEITRENGISIINMVKAAANVSKKAEQVEKNLLLKAKDKKIVLRIKLLSLDYNALASDEYISSAYELDSAISYVNTSENVTEFVNKFKSQKKADVCTVNCVGLDDQKGTKVDVSVSSENLGQKIISLSLKTLTKQLGQVGTGWRIDQNSERKIRGIADLLEGIFSISLNDELYREKYVNAIENRLNDRAAAIQVLKEVYKDAVEQINLKAQPKKSKNDKGYIEFLRKMSIGIANEATSGEENVQLLQLGKGSFKLLDFSKLEKYMVENSKNCEIMATYDDKSGFPYINLFLKVSKDDGTIEDYGRLLSIRPKMRPAPSTEFRHYVQKEEGLSNILNVFKK